MNYIQYGREFFHGNSSKWGTNGLFMKGDVSQVIALFGNELGADTLSFVVNSRALVGDGTGYAFLLDSNMKPLKSSDNKYLVTRQIYTDWRDFTPGAALDLYNNPGGNMIGRFYVEEVTQINRKAVRFTCTDCVGVLAGMDDHGGGIYTGQTVADICAEIFAGSGLTYEVGDGVDTVQCFGRLPRANRRTNLGRLLVAAGATLMEKNGVVQIVYLGTGSTSTMYQKNIYLGNGNVVQKDPATAVTVIEHAFYQLAGDKVETLFDNTSEVTPAVDQLVVFSEACHDLTASGSLTISESNANYAIVSGVGTLTGSVYTHTRRQIRKDTGITTYKEHIESIEDNELIGYHNSEYVAQRMANYYAIQTSIEFEALDPAGNLLPGSPVNFTDPFGVARTGWIHKKDYAIGNKTRAKWEIPVGWTPGPWGSNLDAWEIFDEAGTFTWTVPAGVTSLTAQLVGGGQAGFDGSDGSSGSMGSSDQWTGSGEGGPGGEKGLGGQPGKANAVTISVTPGQTVTITIGTGGQSNGEEGAATTITVNGTTYTSADGVVPVAGITNTWTGETYALKGPDGVNGADGGKKGTKGEDLESWTGGARGRDYTYSVSAYHGTYDDTPALSITGTGGGGGGAAHGANGSGGNSGSASCRRSGVNGYGCHCASSNGGDGGNGANATTDPYEVGLAGGGAGGNGGGGGGGGGDGNVTGDTAGLSIHGRRGWGGYGGSGSPGTPGGNGLALLMYKQATAA